MTQNSFRICVLESGLGTNGSAVVNWIAFRGTPSGALDGAASFNAFTSGTKCERVDFVQVWFRCRDAFSLPVLVETIMGMVARGKLSTHLRS